MNQGSLLLELEELLLLELVFEAIVGDGEDMFNDGCVEMSKLVRGSCELGVGAVM